ncbi:hydroxymethylglutaryl-CoA lyase [Halioglobus japonicus]|uniref:Hydroxymethylglutaryl-CoA lyase n=1 Tax=Halioglobus japonicus TaxID=930805 RepID=A0AAP8MI65_9GAMM|nr:hydroxymethylglutaryl-CoA lyase [Halioglobus japonicus]AQA19100.1 hydroxymethylglutaryl-CoA lyase [Halioglobus japonicus]PLW87874.1 hydroxymethylglutaryl-CoA lyase [Halioglobus japonicus]GHD06100.1 hydroxymethylglutaryl-CoA lyase [Halioglobus japonicus]
MNADSIVINEVGPRDGLQSQDRHLSVEERQRLIEALVDCGIAHIEAGSFVSPKAVPQMAGTGQLFAQLPEAVRPLLSALVPNMKGYELACKAGAQTVAVVVSATETMNQKNIGKSLDDTLAMARDIISRGHNEGVRVQAYLSVAFECPFEGLVAPATIERQAESLAAWGADEIVIADTIGAADPGAVRRLMDSLAANIGPERLACHFHDTRALGLANVYAAIESGVRRFDSSIGGLGGCPFAPGAKGNVATEDVVMLCERLGFITGIKMPALLQAVSLASELTGHPQGGRAHYWLTNNAA